MLAYTTLVLDCRAWTIDSGTRLTNHPRLVRRGWLLQREMFTISDRALLASWQALFGERDTSFALALSKQHTPCLRFHMHALLAPSTQTNHAACTKSSERSGRWNNDEVARAKAAHRWKGIGRNG
jgi:hypothetical protein